MKNENSLKEALSLILAMFKRPFKWFNQWIESQSKARKTVFYAGSFVWVSLYVWLTYFLTHTPYISSPPERPSRMEVAGMVVLGILCYAGWPALCFNWRKRGLNRVPPGKPSLLKRFYKHYHVFCARQSLTRKLVFVTGELVLLAVFLWFAWMLGRSPHHLVLSDVVTLGVFGLCGYILCPLVCFKWKAFTLGRRKIAGPKLFGWWLVTIWLSCFVTTPGQAMVAVPHLGPALLLHYTLAAAANPAPTNAPAVTSPKVERANQPPTAEPKILACELIIAILVIVVGGIMIYMMWQLLCKLGFCGSTGNNPTNSPSGGNGTNAPEIIAKNVRIGAGAKVAINTNVPLPVTIFYLSNGNIISNSTGVLGSACPAFLSVNGMSAPNGSEIDSPLPGITTPPSIGLWLETNTYYDSNLDPTYPYTAVLNYTVLTKTNLAGAWRECATVVEWVNENPRVPLMSSVTYTNGQPLATNWTQFFMGSNPYRPTNIVVYGALPSVYVENPPVLQVPYTGPLDTNPPPPPPLPGSTYTNGPEMPPIIALLQYFKLTCDTNQIETSWPWKP